MEQEIEPVTVDEYQEYHQKADDLMRLVCLSETINPEWVSVRNIVQYFQSSYPIAYIAYSRGMAPNLHKSIVTFDDVRIIDPAFTEGTDGFTTLLPDDLNVTFINVDKPITRITYSILHELMHVAFHFSDPTIAELFRGRDPFAPYTPEQRHYEREAGYLAGMMLMTDNQLSTAISSGKTFDRICHDYGISRSALHNRIFGWLSYTMQYNQALSAVLNYGRGDARQIQWVVNTWNSQATAQ
ncbi:MAG: ImmA/IrrE family metallo-endopeptidase [Lactobacillus sp.]|jgi:Zn-dependent peptidase ImmA (M78 family)|nr:ImmA/IrrE family metallo-endopeptidase [Lactobacillus sp.]MCI2033584.1 ImmA/IrrE family metallo-endopeptidase [Lactobacillus sp.]